MLVSLFCNFVYMALVAHSISIPTSNNITSIPIVTSNSTTTEEINRNCLSNEDVLNIQLARRHAIRMNRRSDTSQTYTNAITTIAILRDALELPLFMEKINPLDPLLQKLKQEKEDSDDSPQSSLMAICNVCGGSSISTCRCSKEAQRKHREEYYNVE
jgi:hypothetical protein